MFVFWNFVILNKFLQTFPKSRFAIENQIEIKGTLRLSFEVILRLSLSTQFGD